MNAAPNAIYNYAYTAWAGRMEVQAVFIGEMEAVDPNHARSRIRALHRTMRLKVPRTIKLGQACFLRLTSEAPLRVRFHRNSKPIAEIADVSVIRASFPAQIEPQREPGACW